MKIHFISGLPRSGSTLLAAILRQNPRFRAAIQSPLSSIVQAVQKSMSGATDSALFLSDSQRWRVLKAAMEAFYADVSEAKVVFDSSRLWPSCLPIIGELFPDALVLCCLRNPAWIIDSIERQVRRTSVQPSRMFNFETGTNVYSRTEFMMKSQLLGPSLQNVREAWFGEDARRIIAVRYDSLAERPADVVDRVYDLIGEERFSHDFDNLEYDEPCYDSWLGMPGFHRVVSPVERRIRTTILPPEIFAQYDECFWDIPDQNPRSVVIL